MSTLLVGLACGLALVGAYFTYGKWLARHVFQLDPEAEVPSRLLRDDVDYVPTHRQIIFGHHFTSIAGTGPIVGPAIAVFWGWLPALAWVVLGAIFVGAVHDLGSLVVSLRNRGQTVGEIAGRLISPRARILFLAVLFLALILVLAVFGLIIATIFAIYPESVLPTWISLPLAVVLGVTVHRKGWPLLWPSLACLAIVYGCVYVGAYYLPIDIGRWLAIPVTGPFPNAVLLWTFVLLMYCFFASVLPVWIMLQPRDYINSHQLVVALALLVTGAVVAGATGKADLISSAPAIASVEERPVDAPPIWPFLFITIACGACSGFHCLVSSGTTSKQIARETDALYVAYGSMLLEAGLAVVVVLACCAGVGMVRFDRIADGSFGFKYVEGTDSQGNPLRGRAAWESRYKPHADGAWSKFELKEPVAAFVEGGANFLSAIGIPIKLGVPMIAVLVACFAATTMDTATRLQRYVIQELAASLKLRPFVHPYAATGLAIVLSGLLALIPANESLGPGSGGKLLWPLFGATNQLLAGLAFLVTAFYLRRRNMPIFFLVIPLALMVAMPAWAMLYQMFDPQTGWWVKQRYVLFTGSGIILAIQFWMVAEALWLWFRVKGVLEAPLPPLPVRG